MTVSVAISCQEVSVNFCKFISSFHLFITQEDRVDEDDELFLRYG